MRRLLAVILLGVGWLGRPELAIAVESTVRQACATRRLLELPIPFADVPPDHWAFEAVMSLYYCGADRGGIPPASPSPQP
ncbi:MAG: hypothetical protein Q6J33_08480 [Gloeomargarita sp. DG_2_bins_126]